MAKLTYLEGFNKAGESLSILRGVSSHLSEFFMFLLHARRFHLFHENDIAELRLEVSLGQIRPESLLMMLDIASHEIQERRDPISSLFLEDIQRQVQMSCHYTSSACFAICSSIFGLYSIDDEWFDEYYAKLFDQLLPGVFSEYAKTSGEFSQPEELTQLVHRLCEGSVIRSIYNPFAGTGSFSAIASGAASYFGQEINDHVSALGVLRMYAHGLDPHCLICEDSFLNWGHGNNRFDLVVSFPPLGLKVPTTQEMGLEWKTASISMEDFFIRKGSESLNKGGKLIGILSNSFLFTGGATGALRKQLVEDGRVEAIIQLPAGLLYYSGVSICLVIINDGSHRTDSVRFIDASAFFVKEHRRNVLQVDSVLQALETANSSVSTAVSISDIRANDYRLVPSFYIGGVGGDGLSIPEGFEAVPLKEVVLGYRTVISSSEEARIVRGRDLLSDKDGIDSTFENLEQEPLEGKRFGRLDRDAILIQKVRSLKPTLFHYKTGVEVVLSSNIVPFIPKEGIDPYYLVAELRKDYVSLQVEKLASGAYIPSLRHDDILSIKVLLPLDRGVQHSLFISGQRLERETQLKAALLDERIQRERERISEMMKIRRHRIKPYISGLKDSVSMMLDQLYDGHIDGSVELSEGYNLQLALEDMEVNLADLEKLFAVFTADSNIGEVETVDLLSFIRQYSFTHTIPGKHFELKKELAENKRLFPKVLFNRDNLKEVFDEIIHNAEKHFPHNVQDGQVMLIPRVERGVVSILICNNGTPVPPDFDEERSFVAGYHKDENGTGMGLSRVRQLCDEFGATIRWENDVNNTMPVGLRISFSISKD